MESYDKKNNENKIKYGMLAFVSSVPGSMFFLLHVSDTKYDSYADTGAITIALIGILGLVTAGQLSKDEETKLD